MNTIAPLRGSLRSVCRSTRRRIRSGRGFGGAGRGTVPSASSGPSMPLAHSSSSSGGEGDADADGVGGRTWMTQLWRSMGELGERRRKKRVSDGWSFSLSATRQLRV